MGRLLRVTNDGLVFHAMDRGNNGADALTDDRAHSPGSRASRPGLGIDLALRPRGRLRKDGGRHKQNRPQLSSKQSRPQ